MSSRGIFYGTIYAMVLLVAGLFGHHVNTSIAAPPRGETLVHIGSTPVRGGAQVVIEHYRVSSDGTNCFVLVPQGLSTHSARISCVRN